VLRTFWSDCEQRGPLNEHPVVDVHARRARWRCAGPGTEPGESTTDTPLQSTDPQTSVMRIIHNDLLLKCLREGARTELLAFSVLGSCCSDSLTLCVTFVSLMRKFSPFLCRQRLRITDCTWLVGVTAVAYTCNLQTVSYSICRSLQTRMHRKSLWSADLR